MTVNNQKTSFRSIAGFLFWVGICFFVAWTASLVTPEAVASEWYRSLNKPVWNPPDWLFGPVWGLLYAFMGIAAWQVWRKFGFREAGIALFFFLVQLVLNGLWTQIFFGFRNPGLAFIEIIFLLAAIFVSIILFFQKDKLAGWLMVPYFLWVGFATALNGAIWMMN
ncbi:MAG: TspO/MBR family protein [Balneolaceae bacterium]